MKIFSWPSATLILVAALVLLHYTGISLSYAQGRETVTSFDLLFRVGLLCSVVWWLERDSRRHKVTPVYCLGLLVSIAWMIVVPYHLFKTRGMKGVIILLGLLGVFIATQFVALILYMLFFA